ncbi:MAG: hypothetical protein IKQ29_02935 [Bacilli bacterium]|nr:hypothetical protein [Bacilli bacterium]
MTSGYELSTAITNLFIFITSIFIFIKVKNNNRWNLFYLFLILDSFMGIIVHGISMSNNINNILWIILYILFSITFNLLLYIFCNMKLKNVFILSILIFIIMFIIFSISIKYNIKNLDNIVILLYALLLVLISLYNIIKSNYIYKYYYIIGIIIQIIGIIPIFIKLNIGYFNYNGICHIFSNITIILLYLGIKKENI